MSNFWQRTVTGVFFVAILVSLTLWLPISLSVLLLPVSLMGLREFFDITHRPKTQIAQPWAFVVAACLYILLCSTRMFNLPASQLVLIVPLIGSILVLELFRKEKRPINNIAYSIFGIGYIIIPFALLTYIRVNPAGEAQSPWLLLGFFCALWSNDTGAYLVGRAVGKHKLFERISPKKTWEGFIGGLFFCLINAYIFAQLETALNLWQWFGFCLIVGVFGTLGDLIESMIKRNYGVKDSGNILPGHGGILDRFDGIFLAAPMIVSYLELVK